VTSAVETTASFLRLATRCHVGLALLALLGGSLGWVSGTVGAAERMTAAAASIQAGDAGRHIGVLADDALEGREGGTRGGRAAAAYVVEQLERLGIQPAGDEGGYYQRFGGMRNILAVIPGSDPALAGELVVVGAHYDHVGYGTAATSYGPFGYVHNGADDNASGVAGLLEIAEAIGRLPERPRRTILLAFWDGEEKGLLGSNHFVRVRPAGLAGHRIVCSVNMDMIGRLRGGRLEVYGSRTAVGLREAVVQANSRGSTGAGLDLVFVWDIEEDSDHFPFIAAGVPTVMFHTGLHDNYHRPSDDAHLVNLAGIEPVSRLALAFVQAAADSLEPLPEFRPACRDESNTTRNRIEAAVPESAAGPGGRWGLGTRDDPGEPGSPVVVRVWRDSAAERGGLRVGDRILAIDAARITSQDDMVSRLRLAPATIAVDVERRGRIEHLQLEAGTAQEKGPVTGP
jgi:Zn-dependent M28 family amino/carboxypeptidase